MPKFPGSDLWGLFFSVLTLKSRVNKILAGHLSNGTRRSSGHRVCRSSDPPEHRFLLHEEQDHDFPHAPSPNMPEVAAEKGVQQAFLTWIEIQGCKSGARHRCFAGIAWVSERVTKKWWSHSHHYTVLPVGKKHCISVDPWENQYFFRSRPKTTGEGTRRRQVKCHLTK